MLAARLAFAAAATLLVPGLLVSSALRLRANLAERIVLSFAISYCWLLLLAVFLPLTGATIAIVPVATAVLCACALWPILKRRGRWNAPIALPSAMDVTLIAFVAAFACAAWVIEGRITGEEAVDLASATRFADGGRISFTNTSLLPDTVPVYLLQPYQLAVAAISRYSGVEPLVAFVKLRSALMLLSLTSIYALLRRLAPSRGLAEIAFAVSMLFIALDLPTWEYNSLFPFVRRGGFSEGVLVPALMVLGVIATRKPYDDGEDGSYRVARYTLPVMLFASLSTHPLEMAPYLCFLGALGVAIVFGFDPRGDRRALVQLGALVFLAVGLYFAVHDRAVRAVVEFEAPQKQSLANALLDQSKEPLGLFFGRMSRDSRDLISRLLPDTIVAVIGVPALVVLVWMAPVAAAVLALAIVPLVLAYASPGGYLTLALLTSDATVHDVNSYFGLLGLLALSLALAAAALFAVGTAARVSRGIGMQVLLTLVLGTALIAVAWLALSPATSASLAWTMATPAGAVAAAAVVAVIVLGVARALSGSRGRAWPGLPCEVTGLMTCVTAMIAIAAALPLTRAGRDPEQRLNLEPSIFVRYEHALSEAPVYDWPAYYETLRSTIKPQLPVPAAVVDDLRARLPPRQVMLADPRYSCGIVVLLDAYCVNPESIYGHYFLTAAPYFEEYVHDGEGGTPWHPIFNQTPGISDGERKFLMTARVAYVLADPDRSVLIASKLSQSGLPVTPIMLQEGWALFKVGR